MGQPDLSTNSLTSHTDVFADIINTLVYGGRRVVARENLTPYYVNSATEGEDGSLKGLYRDNCMRDMHDGITYVIWGLENQYALDYTTPFKVMGYDYAAYSRQIEEYEARNRKAGIRTYTKGILKEQKLKPVITIVLYYGKEELPDSICGMIEQPEEEAVRKYIQNYHLNLIKLSDLTREQAESFQSDFRYIAKFLSRSYERGELIKNLKRDTDTIVHTKALLHTLASITRDDRYLEIEQKVKEENRMCELLDAILDEGIEQGIEQGIERGIERGIDQEREQGIRLMIEACQELGASRSLTIEKLKTKYALRDGQSDAYVEKYWK